MVVLISNTRISMPAHMHSRIGSMLLVLAPLFVYLTGRRDWLIHRRSNTVLGLVQFLFYLVQVVVRRAYSNPRVKYYFYFKSQTIDYCLILDSSMLSCPRWCF